MPDTPLPDPTQNQPYFSVSVLEAGHLVLEEWEIVTSETPSAKHKVPSLAFLLRHSATQQGFLFDLGIRKDVMESAPPSVRAWLPDMSPTIPKDVVESLAEGSVKPEQVDIVCISHFHWDHTGDTSLFTKAEFVVGGETANLQGLNPGYPEEPKSFYPSNLLPKARSMFLPSTSVASKWKKIGPFDHALDFFNDGLLYIVDAPGHMPGHLNILARTSPDGGWVYLAGDTAHDWLLIRGEGKVPVLGDGCGGLHEDVDRAKDTISRVAKIYGYPRVRVLLSHDREFWDEHAKGDRPYFWPGQIPSL